MRRRKGTVQRNTGEQHEDPERLMLAYLCIRDAKGAVAQVRILDRFGLSDAEIARVCGIGPQSVRNARLKGKKQTPRKEAETTAGRETQG